MLYNKHKNNKNKSNYLFKMFDFWFYTNSFQLVCHEHYRDVSQSYNIISHIIIKYKLININL